MPVNFVEVWRRLRQASPSLRRPMATVYELEPGGVRARQIFCHQRPDRTSAGTFTAVLIHRRGQIRRGALLMAAKSAKSDHGRRWINQGARVKPAAPNPAGDFASDVCYFEPSPIR